MKVSVLDFSKISTNLFQTNKRKAWRNQALYKILRKKILMMKKFENLFRTIEDNYLLYQNIFKLYVSSSEKSMKK